MIYEERRKTFYIHSVYRCILEVAATELKEHEACGGRMVHHVIRDNGRKKKLQQENFCPRSAMVTR